MNPEPRTELKPNLVGRQGKRPCREKEQARERERERERERALTCGAGVTQGLETLPINIKQAGAPLGKPGKKPTMWKKIKLLLP